MKRKVTLKLVYWTAGSECIERKLESMKQWRKLYNVYNSITIQYKGESVQF